MDTSTDSSPSTARLPGWLVEALDVLSARRRIVVATAVGIVLLGGIVAILAPSILPARAIVGAAVGIAAALLATAVALAMDASDLVVRGARHVRAAGGTIDVRVGRQHDDVGPLLVAVARHASNGRVRVALAPASRSAGVPGVRAAALAEALARTGRKVLLTDLTRGGTPAAGLSDVITGTRTLADVVRFEQELYLARLAVGSDPDAALNGFAQWVEALPSDLEVLVAALPPLAEKGVLPAAGAMDLTLVLVEVERTERVDLIASLDAVDASGVTSELVLVDPARSITSHATGAPTPDPDTSEHDDAEDDEVEAGTDEDAEDQPAEDAEDRDAEPLGYGDHGRPDEPTDDEADLTGTPAAVFTDEEAHAASFDDVPDAWTPTPVGEDDDVSPDPGEDLHAEFGLDEPTSPAFAPAPVPSVDLGPGTDEGDDHDPDATAEIGPFPAWDDDADADDDASIIEHDAPAATPPAAPSEPAPSPTASTEPGPAEPAPVAPPDEPSPAEDDELRAPAATAFAPAAPEPDEAPAPRPEPSAPRHDTSRHDTLAPTSWERPAESPRPETPAARPADTSPPETPAQDTNPARPAASTRTEDRGAPHLDDPAALEVARASAALHQLAQQIWDRDEA